MNTLEDCSQPTQTTDSRGTHHKFDLRVVGVAVFAQPLRQQVCLAVWNAAQQFPTSRNFQRASYSFTPTPRCNSCRVLVFADSEQFMASRTLTASSSGSN